MLKIKKLNFWERNKNKSMKNKKAHHWAVFYI